MRGLVSRDGKNGQFVNPFKKNGLGQRFQLITSTHLTANLLGQPIGQTRPTCQPANPFNTKIVFDVFFV